jgi:hypothetical protein
MCHFSSNTLTCADLLLFTIDLLIPERYVHVNRFLIPLCMSKTMGRPPLPKGEAKGVQIGVRFKRDEGKVIEKAAADRALGKADWLRLIALEAPRPIWIICRKWGAADLNRKTVEFKFTVQGARGDYVSGLGRFFVIPHRDGARLAIEIHGPPSHYYRLTLSEQMADSIERHADPSFADFRCFAVVPSA